MSNKLCCRGLQSSPVFVFGFQILTRIHTISNQHPLKMHPSAGHWDPDFGASPFETWPRWFTLIPRWATVLLVGFPPWFPRKAISNPPLLLWSHDQCYHILPLSLKTSIHPMAFTPLPFSGPCRSCWADDSCRAFMTSSWWWMKRWGSTSRLLGIYRCKKNAHIW